MKVLIQYKTSSKVREVAEYNELLTIIESIFDIKKGSYRLQKYDIDFDEYVDFEECSPFEEKCKIKVIDFNGNDTLDEEISNNREYLQRISSIEKIQSPVMSNLRSRQWPNEINLPFEKFSSLLTEALETNSVLNWSLSSELITHLANYAYTFKKYPCKAERIQLCEAVIHKFPHLKNDLGIGIIGWEKKLLNKLKKLRHGDDSLEIELNRTKRKSTERTIPKKIKLNPERGEINWAPDHFTGENEASQCIHKQIMKDECQKRVSFQNKNKIKFLMDLTYSFRRAAINEKVGVKYLIDEYPAFFQEEEQFEEFRRLTATNMRETFFTEVQSNGWKLLELFFKKKSDSFKKSKEEVILISQLLRDKSMPKDTKKIRSVLGVFILPYLFKEPENYFIEVIDEGNNFAATSPKIFSIGCITKKKFYIVAENEIICQSRDLLTAVALLISFYFTMSLRYPTEISCTLKFIQKYFLRINGGSVPQKVITLLDKINALK